MDVLSSMGTCGEAMSSRSSMEIVCVPAKVAKIQDTLEARTMEEWADGLTWSQRSVRISLNRVRKITRAFHEGSEKKLAWKIKGNCTSDLESLEKTWTQGRIGTTWDGKNNAASDV